jgi:ParB/RepB/Spo0J family partition protein
MNDLQQTSGQQTHGVLALIDPKSIRRPEHNRSSAAFTNEDFQSLLASVKAAGGNTTHIEVVQIEHPDFTYELVSGERRVHCCEILNLSVYAAVIPKASAKEILMKRILENSFREKHSPVELGQICNDAIDKGVFTGVGDFALNMGLDKSQTHKAMRAARITPEVRNLLEASGGMTYAMVDTLLKLENDHLPELLQAVQAIKDSGEPMKAGEVVRRLKQWVTSQLQKGSNKGGVERFHSGHPRAIAIGEKELGKLIHTQDGRLKMSVDQEVDSLTAQAIYEAVIKVLAKKSQRRRRSNNTTDSAKVV